MYTTLLALHSFFRWFVLASLIVATYRAYRGWFSNKPFTPFDNTFRLWTATMAHFQLVLGVWLYIVSPVIDYFLHNFSEAVHQREARFFGMEHSLMMLIAIVIVTIGSVKAKRASTDKEKFRSMAIWYSVGLVVIFTSIPWSFSPLTSRPNIRYF